MIVVDSSVWIAHLRDVDTREVRLLRAVSRNEEGFLMGDLVLLEVLQGARSDLDAVRIQYTLRSFPVVSMLEPDLAIQAAKYSRLLRSKGFTIRKVADVIIGTFCIERRHRLLHQDRDFEPMVAHLGLQTA